MPSMDDICNDLWGEHDELDQVVAPLGEQELDTPTPAEPWSVRDQIAHLTYYDDRATFAVADPEGFRDWRDNRAIAEIVPAEGDPADLAIGRSLSGADLLAKWRAGRAAMLEVFRPLDPKSRIAWFGPDMSAVSFATARLMECWAHGQDIYDALGLERRPNDHIKHICHIGVTAFRWSYTVRNLDVPTEPIRVEVKAPSGELWTWGPEDAVNRVTGTALDLALVVTQRRHRDDTNLVAEGPVADEWLSIAQAFAGPPGPGRKPGQFAK